MTEEDGAENEQKGALNGITRSFICQKCLLSYKRGIQKTVSEYSDHMYIFVG